MPGLYDKKNFWGDPSKIESEFDAMAKYYDLESLYTKERIDEIKSGMITRIKVLRNGEETASSQTEKRIERFVDKVTEIFGERQVCAEGLINVGRQISEMRDWSANPAKINFNKFDQQAQINIPLRSKDDSFIGFNSSKIGFGERLNKIPGYEYEGVYDDIEVGRTPKYHTQQPDKIYQNNVMDARLHALQNVRVNEARLDKMLREGRELTDKEEKNLCLRSEALNKWSNRLEGVSKVVTDGLVKNLGKGTIYESKTEEGRYHKRQMRKYYKALADFMHAIGPNHLDGALALTQLKQMNDELSTSDDPYDIELYRNIGGALQSKIADLKKAIDVVKKTGEESLQGVSDEFYKKSKGYTKKEDDALKWQGACVILAAGLFCPAIGVIGPLSHIFLNPFISSAPFATSLANTMTMLGPFSYFAEISKVPYATEWLMNNTPLVNVVLGNDGMMDLLFKNPVSQNFFGMVSPMIGSPITGLAAVAVATTYRASKDVPHYIEKFDEAKKNEEKFKSVAKKYADERSKEVEKNTNQAINSLDEQRQKSGLIPAVAEVIARIAATNLEALKVFGDLKFSYKTADGKDAQDSLYDWAAKAKPSHMQAYNLIKNAKLPEPDLFYQKVAVLDSVLKEKSKDDLAIKFKATADSVGKAQEIYVKFQQDAAKEILMREAKRKNVDPSFEDLKKYDERKAKTLKFTTLAPDATMMPAISRGIEKDKIASMVKAG